MSIPRAFFALRNRKGLSEARSEGLLTELVTKEVRHA